MNLFEYISHGHLITQGILALCMGYGLVHIVFTTTWWILDKLLD